MTRMLCLPFALILFASLPRVSAACILTNHASLSANGDRAGQNYSLSGSISFSFARVYGSEHPIGFSENQTDLRRSLTSTALDRPFLWSWGDGTETTARTPQHTYRRPGTYLIRVYAFQLPTDGSSSWLPFDRVQIRVVPPGEVWRDNLGQDALDLLTLLMTWGVRLVLAGLALLLVLGFWYDRRVKRVATRRVLSTE